MDARLKQMCNRLQICSVRPTAKVLGSQCSGPSKSLQATYHCVQANPMKTCLAYDAAANKLVYRDQPTCTDKFKWLDNYILYHIGSKRCVNQYLQMTYNCYSATAVQFKLQDGLMKMLNGKCWANQNGVVVSSNCGSTSKKFEFH